MHWRYTGQSIWKQCRPVYKCPVYKCPVYRECPVYIFILVSDCVLYHIISYHNILFHIIPYYIIAHHIKLCPSRLCGITSYLSTFFFFFTFQRNRRATAWTMHVLQLKLGGTYIIFSVPPSQLIWIYGLMFSGHWCCQILQRNVTQLNIYTSDNQCSYRRVWMNFWKMIVSLPFLHVR